MDSKYHRGYFYPIFFKIQVKQLEDWKYKCNTNNKRIWKRDSWLWSITSRGGVKKNRARMPKNRAQPCKQKPKSAKKMTYSWKIQYPPREWKYSCKSQDTPREWCIL